MALIRIVPIALLVAIGFTTAKANAAPPDAGAVKPAEALYKLKIAPQALGAALQELARQTGSQIIFFSRLTEGLATSALDDSCTLTQAIERLLAGSGLTYQHLGERTFEVRAMSHAGRTAARRRSTSAPPEAKSFQQAIPEILVTGTRDTLNLDVVRTENDVLPFVVFNREQIEQSAASDVQQFLKYQLPMNTLQQTYSQNVGLVFGGRSQVDLRGFGTNQTLILIDGRRTSNAVVNGSLQQQNLNGIALGAVERIEVLPTSASGIYGGDATGGVINIVLRRDYQGAELTVGYDNVFDGEARELSASLTGGLTLDEGKTTASFAAFWSETNLLLRQERHFVHRYRNQAFANRTALWQPPALVPLGYTTNIRSTSSNLTLDDGTPLNSLFTSVPRGYAGAATDSGAGLVANAGHYNFDPADSAQNPGTNNGARASLLSSPSLVSVNILVRREFSSIMEAFLDVSAWESTDHASINGIGSRYTLPADAANNPFQQEIELSVPVPSQDFTSEYRSSDRRLVAGLVSKLPWDWKGELDFVWHRSASRRNAPGYIRRGAGAAIVPAIQDDPNFNPLRDTNVYRLDFSPYMAELFYGPFDTTTRNVTLMLGGPVGRLSSGTPAVNVRLEHRHEVFGGGTFEHRPDRTPLTVYPSKSQTISSALAELRLPLVSANNAQDFARELELQLAVRWDGYRINGSQGQISPGSESVIRTTNELHAINPTAGLRWKPVDDLMLRGSYGTGFLPPNVTQLTPNAPATGVNASTLLDPRRGNQPIGFPLRVQTGGNPELEPEQSEGWSAGVVYTPAWLKGTRISVDFTRIERTDGIAGHPFAIPGMIADESIFPGRIVRGTATPEEAAKGWAGPITFVDLTLLNIARAKTKSWDVQLDYHFPTANLGMFDFYALGTWNRYNVTQTKQGEPSIDDAGFSGGVPHYRINAGMTWQRGPMTLGWNLQYFDSYLTYPAFPAPLTDDQLQSRQERIQSQGSSSVDSQIYHDAFARYRFAAESDGISSALLSNCELTLGIRNAFNRKPPRDQLSYSTYGDPRLASYYISLKKSFQ